MQAYIVYTNGKYDFKELEGLHDLQEIVDGNIEFFDTGVDGLCGYCNEFGKFECMPNPKATKVWHFLWGGDTGDTLYGNIIFCREEGNLFPEDIRAFRKGYSQK